jgi:hypothetical protein
MDFELFCLGWNSSAATANVKISAQQIKSLKLSYFSILLLSNHLKVLLEMPRIHKHSICNEQTGAAYFKHP